MRMPICWPVLGCLLFASSSVLQAQSPTTVVDLRRPAAFGEPTREQLAPGLALVPRTIGERVYVSEPVVPVYSRPLREVAARSLGEPVRRRDHASIVEDYWGDYMRARSEAIIGQGKRPLDALVDRAARLAGGDPTPDPVVSFDGLDGEESGGAAPPDPVIAVGPSHIVQMTNISFAVYDKRGARLAGPTRLSAFWETGACAGGDDGDPIALYDQVADRWLLTQFRASAPYGMCIAVSQTADPLGAYFVYAFDMTFFPDYPKFGIWDDSYTMSAVEFDASSGEFVFAGVSAYAFDRAAMLAGASTGYVRSPLRTDILPILPADVDGGLMPEAGQPALFYTFADASFAPEDQITLFAFDVDWGDPGAATFSDLAPLGVTSFNFDVCGGRSCIRQPNTGNGLDALASRPMNRLVYRRFATHQALAGLWTVDAGRGRTAGQRWFELRNSGAGWSVYQEGTHSPDADSRWMGSAAMDAEGNLAIAYSVSSGSTFPSIRYAGRYVSDPLGVLREEASLVEGAGSATTGNRFGDYSALVIDPADDLTFWFTAEYFDGVGNSQFDWETRIGSFQMGDPPSLAAGGRMQPEPVPAGDAVSVLATATAGPIAISDVAIQATLPDGTVYIGGSATCGGTVSGGIVAFDVGSLAAGASRTCSFKVQTSASTTSTVIAAFADDHEAGTANWSTSSAAGAAGWSLASADPYSGSRHWSASNPSSVSDQRLMLAAEQPIEAGDELVFWHRYNTEDTYDGGVVELSADGGASWVDLGGAMVQNGYTGSLSMCCSNPLGGRSAFTGNSFEYVYTRADLSAFAGEHVLIRFRMASDGSVGDEGWSVDDVWLLRGGTVAGTGTIQSDIAITATGQTARSATASGQVTASQVTAERPVDGNGRVSFDGTGLDIVFAGVEGSATIGVTRIDRPAPNPDGILQPERPGASWTIEPVTDGPFQFGAATEVRIDLGTVPALTVNDPFAITGYKRPGDGTDAFEPLNTRYDALTGELVLSGFTSFSEFTFAGEAGALPVEFSAFDYQLDGPVLLLAWATAGETANAGFDVEIAALDREGAAAPAAGFRSLGFVEGAGTTAEPQRYTFRTEALAPGRYAVRLRQVDFDGTASYSASLDVAIRAPAVLALEAVAPNPARGEATIGFTVPTAGRATVVAYDLLGREVARLFDAEADPGQRHRVAFDAGARAPGVYLLRLTQGSRSQTQRVTVAR